MLKIYISICLLACMLYSRSQTINAAEYFIDNDPGPGNGFPVTTGTGANLNFSASIPTTSLSNGFHFIAIRTRDASGKWGLYEKAGFYISTSTNNVTNITAAEYFIDTDPGAGNGTPLTSGTGANVNFAANIPTSSLSNGFHFIAIRTRDASGKWGLYEKAGFYISTSTNNVSNITAAEYFIDTDPGAGNGTPITSGTGATVNFAANIPTSSLSNGFHFIAIRTRDASGKWGLYEKAGFYISTSTNNVSNITAAEYFIDTDPGAGNGTPLTSGTGANVNFAANIPTSSLSNGFHFIAIRTRDASGKWGLYEKAGFYISTSTNNVSNITAAEYFIDTDPGAGNGTPITSGTGANVNFAANIPTASLSNGFHFVAIRTRDAQGKWGFYEKAGFYISTQTTNSPGMTEAEFFIDADPGVGNGTPFTIPGGQSFSQNFVLPIPVGITPGQHHIAIRVKNGWGLYEFATFTVGGTVPLEFLAFDGAKEDKKVKLSWKTANEINTSHFEIERSANGIRFEKLGEVVSANSAGEHDYLFYDEQPIPGLNYYRLKQVDIDGEATYSQIIRIMFSSKAEPIRIYPNPAVEFVNIEFPSEQKNILINIYDAKGRLVKFERINYALPMRINVNELPAGVYHLQLSDGLKTGAAGFIKN